MRWKQFLTPVDSLDADQVREFINANSDTDFNLIDVRQPREYEAGHIPGARLIPLPELMDRFDEIDRDKPAIVYCAVGGRSRVAAQLMAAEGFGQVLNFKGGFKAWNGAEALGSEISGMHLFTGRESLEAVLATAYGMEAALADMYRSKAVEADNAEAEKIFSMLAAVEDRHKERVAEEYAALLPDADLEAFRNTEVPKAVEGGMTLKEYAALYYPDFEDVRDVVELAMSIEAQGMDLYLRAAGFVSDGHAEDFLLRMADEEKQHLKLLGDLLDSLHDPQGKT